VNSLPEDLVAAELAPTYVTSEFADERDYIDEFGDFVEAPDTDAEPTERHLHAVPPRRRSRPRRPALWLGSVVSVASLFLLVAFNVMMVQGQFTLDRIANQRDTQQNEYEHLRAQVAALGAPETIVSRALQLGLVNGPAPTYISAPAAAPPASSVDRTATTLRVTNATAKGSIAASP
jgi:hypothetical protein